jgi:hypothetical protein
MTDILSAVEHPLADHPDCANTQGRMTVGGTRTVPVAGLARNDGRNGVT